MSSSSVVIIAGPNGAGKSTAAPFLLRQAFAVEDFVNADTIARGLCALRPESVALEAGKIMLRHLRGLAARRASFAFETTLASKTFAPWLRVLSGQGYRVQILFLWLPNEDVAVARVAERVHTGGHHVPEDVIRRRYHAGLKNLFGLYMPVAFCWRVYDNVGFAGPRLVAAKTNAAPVQISDPFTWENIQRQVGHE